MLLALTLSLAMSAEPTAPSKPPSRAWAPAGVSFGLLGAGAAFFTTGLIWRGEQKEPIATSFVVGGVALMSFGALAGVIALRVRWSELHTVQVALGPGGITVMGRF